MRLAIITGGSQGLGLALCQQLAHNGYRVLEFSRSAPHSYSVQADFATPDTAQRQVATALGRFDSTQVRDLLLIQNAGTLQPMGPAARHSPQALLANLNTNFCIPIVVMAQVVAHFQNAPCRKVVANISSGAAHTAYAGWSLYCAAKAGLEHYIHALALEQALVAHPFVPISINPGVMDTAMQGAIRAAHADDFPDVARFVQRKIQGELRTPQAVAAAVCRIVSADSLVPGGRYDVVDFGA